MSRVVYNKHMQYRGEQGRERGAVSIFLVIFFALLIGVITMSFVGIVIRDATQATNNDLSRSAYDSAQAGVEDAKRAVAFYVNSCGGDTASCANAYTSSINNQTCGGMQSLATSAPSLGLDKVGNEILVQSTGNSGFNQAYTCVNIQMNTPDYVNNEEAYRSDVIPLTSTSAFNGVHLNWFVRSDAGMNDTDSFTLNGPCSVTATSSSCSLPAQTAWGANTPTVLRVELISYTKGAAISDATVQADSRTMFLYPVSSGGNPAPNFYAYAQPPTAGSAVPLVPVTCSATSQYSCGVDLGVGATANKQLFLRVTPVYKKTTFQVTLTGPGTPLFNGVQPIVDSTGRANDLFRRVQARIRLQNNVLYPEYALDVNNSICKDYAVGSDVNDFQDNCN